MPRLLSDIEGTISKIVVSSRGPLEESRIRGLLGALPPEVSAIILYSSFDPGIVSPSGLEFDTASYHASLLEKIVAETAPSRKVSLVEIPVIPYIWLQDLFTVLEGKKVIVNLIAPEQDPSVYTTTIGMVESNVLEQNGYVTTPSDDKTGVIASGDILVAANRVFINRQAFTKGIPNKGISKNERIYLENLAKSIGLTAIRNHYDHEREIQFVDYKAEEHFDMAMAALSDSKVVVGDARWGLREMRLPKNIAIHPYFQNLHVLLDRLAEQLSKNYEVVRIPTLPPLYDKAKPRVTNSVMRGSFIAISPRITYTNVLQENRNGVHSAYVPQYPVPGTEPLPQHLEQDRQDFTQLDPDAFNSLQETAYGVYASLGVQTLKVPFHVRNSINGSLRCSLKVLDRK